MTDNLPRTLQKGRIFKQKLAEGRAVSGAWSTLGSPEVACLMARAGLDYLLVDLEHGRGGIDGLVVTTTQPRFGSTLGFIVDILSDSPPDRLKQLLRLAARSLWEQGATAAVCGCSRAWGPSPSTALPRRPPWWPSPPRLRTRPCQ